MKKKKNRKKMFGLLLIAETLLIGLIFVPNFASAGFIIGDGGDGEEKAVIYTWINLKFYNDDPSGVGSDRYRLVFWGDCTSTTGFFGELILTSISNPQAGYLFMNLFRSNYLIEFSNVNFIQGSGYIRLTANFQFVHDSYYSKTYYIDLRIYQDQDVTYSVSTSNDASHFPDGGDASEYHLIDECEVNPAFYLGQVTAFDAPSYHIY